MDFIKKSQREKAFLQACRVQALDKQQLVKEHIKDLLARWAIEEQNELLRKGFLTIADKPDEGVDPNKFRQKYRGVKARGRPLLGPRKANRHGFMMSL